MIRNQKSVKRKSKKIRGRFEDSQRWIRCWNCHAPLDTHRSDLIGGAGNSRYDNSVPSEISDNDPRNRIATIDALGMLGVVRKNGADDLPLAIYSPKVSQASGGCWNCGTNNLP